VAPTADPSDLYFNDAPPNTIYPDTIGDTSSFGTAWVSDAVRYVTASGFGATLFGTASVVNAAQAVYLTSIDPGSFGATVIRLQTQWITPRGFEFEQASLPFVTRPGQYIPQRPQPITLDFGYGTRENYPGGSVILEFAPPNAYLTIRYVGLGDLSKYGAATVTQPQVLDVSGINNSAFGTATVYNTTTFVLPGGITPNPQTGTNSLREAPSPTIDLRTKYALPTSIAPPVTPFGTHYVAGYFQFIDQAGRGSGPETFGTALAAYKIRTLYPSFIVSDSYGTPLVGRARNVYPTGFGGGTIPITHTVEDYSNRIAPHTGSADPVSYGVAGVRNAKLFVYPNTSAWIGSQVNFPVPYNLRQVLTVQQFQGTDADTAKYGQLTITNRNRQLTTFGHQDSRFSYYAADIANAARAITPDGLDATLFGASLVAYRIRYVSPVGFDSFYTYGTIVYNAARVIGAAGVAPFGVGQPLVFNRNRTISQYFPYSGESFGTSFVAYRVRSLVQQPFNDVPASLPEVRFNPQAWAPTPPVVRSCISTGTRYSRVLRTSVHRTR